MVCERVPMVGEAGVGEHDGWALGRSDSRIAGRSEGQQGKW